MFNKDRWTEILEVMSSNLLRTVATAFGVFWGISILIILLSAGKGLENGIRQDFGDIAYQYYVHVDTCHNKAL